MGRGQKKGNKKAQDPPDISTLSISEPQPSTSVPAPATEAQAEKVEAKVEQPKKDESKIEEPEEGGLGLTGGSSKSRRKKKEKPPQSALPGATPAAASIPPPFEGQATQPEPKKEETGGLGLAPSTRQRNRKPKGTPLPESAPAASSLGPTTSGAPGTQWPQPAVTTPQPQTVQPQHGQPQWSQPQQGQPQRGQPQPGQPQPGQPQWSQPQRGQPQRGQPQTGHTPWGQPQPAQPQWGQPQPQPAQPQVVQPQPAQPQPAQPQRVQPQPAQSQRVQPQVPQAQAARAAAPRPVVNVRGLSIPHKIPPVGQLVQFRPTRVLTNYLAMEIKSLKIHRYDVSFAPDKPKKMIPRAFVNTMQANKFPVKSIAFDQVKNCYCLKPLPIGPNERFAHNTEVIDNNGRAVKFEVSLKFTGIVDYKTILDYMRNKGSSLNPPTEAIQCIDVVLRQATLQDYIKAGRQFFRRPANPIDLTSGLEMWTGLFQSAIFTSRAFINIDIAHKGFPKCQPLIMALTKDFGLDTNGPIERQRGRGVELFENFIKNLRVMALIGGDQSSKGQKREYMCNGLVEPPANLRFVFNSPDGKEVKMTVAEYFSKVKGIRLKYPNLNCVWVGPRDKSIYYPMELLEISYGQVCNKQLNEMQLSTMVRTAAAPPNDRRLKIEEVKKAIKYSTNEYFKNFGLDISDEFTQVEAKILQPPMLAVGPRQTITPRNGSWMARGLLKPQPLESWGFIAIEVNERFCDFPGMIDMIGKVGTEMGMTVAKPKICDFNARIDNMTRIFLDAVDREVKFLFIIVSTRGRDYYQRVKRMAERDVGILTQCVKEFTASKRMNMQTVKNILLKVNSKLMGINQALDNRSMPQCLKGGGVMVVGADVTHPSPDQQNVPSIAAVTASMDPDCYMYNIELSVQSPKKEMIMDFEEMMVDHLKIYKQRQRQLPNKIFYFRDGVSEGQFAEVMNCEITAMTRAYARMAGPQGRVPEILFLLVQKRHHTRFFLGNKDSKNVEPGTVVDTEIVHASELDFYLVSHQAIKGTARPTRYHAVQNDGKIPSDQVEQLTYYLCHLYSRCMRAVSYPTPTYYAHLACMRAKALTYGDTFDNQALERNPVRLRVLNKMLEYSRMFFV